MFKTFSYRQFDYLLVILALSLNTIGLLAIGSAAPDLQLKQFMGMVLGVLVMVGCSMFDYSKLLKGFALYYLITIALLILVLLLGSTGGGAQRWFAIGGITFQPSEAAKILLILFFAAFVQMFKDRMGQLMFTGIMLLFILPPLYLILKQPDLSTTIVVFLIFCTVLFVGGIPYKFVLIVLSAAIPLVSVFFYLVLQEGQTFLNEYQQGRILSWLFPDRYPDLAFQTLNSITAIGSGQLTGKGYNNNEISSVLNSGFISQSQTDFIFTVISEEFGFIGSIAVVFLILFITLRCFMIARRAKDTAGMIICAGVGAWVGFQGYINIGVVTGLLPNTGLPLPFVSYGLTSLLSLYLGLGFVLNVRMQSAPQQTATTVGRIRTPIM